MTLATLAARAYLLMMDGGMKYDEAIQWVIRKVPRNLYKYHYWEIHRRMVECQVVPF